MNWPPVSIPDRYNLNKFIEAIQKPKKVKRELERIHYHTVGNQLFKLNHKFIDPMQKDWDNLIILDACRFDYFEEVNTLPGELNAIFSNSGHSREFFKKNICGEYFHDTVYVTANPHAPMCTGVFFKKVTTYSGNKKYNTGENLITETKAEDGRVLINNHSENLDPKKITHKTLQMYEAYPNKRLIIHFMQPHRPYLGKRAKSLREALNEQYGIHFSAWNDLQDIDQDTVIADLMESAREGYISNEELKEIYIENIEIVLEYVADLIAELDGKTVVTADHGEFLGKERFGRTYYTHFEEIMAEELRKVPLLCIESEQRRSVTAEQPIDVQGIDTEDIDKQLELLGYE